MIKKPRNKFNSFKEIIKKNLAKDYKIYNNQQLYVDDLYHLTFSLLIGIDADKFINDFFKNNVLDHQRLCATALRMVNFRGLHCKSEGSPKVSHMAHTMYSSSFNSKNLVFNPDMIDNTQSVDDYLPDYRLTPQAVKEQLTADELITFNKMLEKETKYYYNTKNLEYKALADKIRSMKKGGGKQ